MKSIASIVSAGVKLKSCRNRPQRSLTEASIPLMRITAAFCERPVTQSFMQSGFTTRPRLPSPRAAADEERNAGRGAGPVDGFLHRARQGAVVVGTAGLEHTSPQYQPAGRCQRAARSAVMVAPMTRIRASDNQSCRGSGDPAVRHAASAQARPRQNDGADPNRAAPDAAPFPRAAARRQTQKRAIPAPAKSRGDNRLR